MQIRTLKSYIMIHSSMLQFGCEGSLVKLVNGSICLGGLGIILALGEGIEGSEVLQWRLRHRADLRRLR